MKSKKSSKIISMVLAIIMVVGMLPLSVFPVLAEDAGYTGSGTKASPYLVTTYEGLRTCLTLGEDYKECYIKLANSVAYPTNKSGYALEAKRKGLFYLDLNGYFVSKLMGNAEQYLFHIPYSSNLTIYSSVANQGGVRYNGMESSAIFHVEGGDLIIGEASNEYMYHSVGNVFGGTYSSNGFGITSGNGSDVYVGRNAQLTARNSVIFATNSYIGLGKCTLENSSSTNSNATIWLLGDSQAPHQNKIVVNDDVTVKSTCGSLVELFGNQDCFTTELVRIENGVAYDGLPANGVLSGKSALLGSIYGFQVDADLNVTWRSSDKYEKYEISYSGHYGSWPQSLSGLLSGNATAANIKKPFVRAFYGTHRHDFQNHGDSGLSRDKTTGQLYIKRGELVYFRGVYQDPVTQETVYGKTQVVCLPENVYLDAYAPIHTSTQPTLQRYEDGTIKISCQPATPASGTVKYRYRVYFYRDNNHVHGDRMFYNWETGQFRAAKYAVGLYADHAPVTTDTYAAAVEISKDGLSTRTVIYAAPDDYTYYFEITPITTGSFYGEDDEVVGEPITIAKTLAELKAMPTYPKKLDRITATTPNSAGVRGTDFDRTDLAVTAHYTDGTKQTVTDYTLSGGSSLTLGANYVTISYTEDDVTKTTKLYVEGTEAVIPEIEVVINGFNPQNTTQDVTMTIIKGAEYLARRGYAYGIDYDPDYFKKSRDIENGTPEVMNAYEYYNIPFYFEPKYGYDFKTSGDGKTKITVHINDWTYTNNGSVYYNEKIYVGSNTYRYYYVVDDACVQPFRINSLDFLSPVVTPGIQFGDNPKPLLTVNGGAISNDIVAFEPGHTTLYWPEDDWYFGDDEIVWSNDYFRYDFFATIRDNDYDFAQNLKVTLDGQTLSSDAYSIGNYGYYNRKGIRLTKDYNVGASQYDATNPRWDGATAKWDAPADTSYADAYYVELYKDGKSVGGASTAVCEFDFADMVREKGEGKYTFRILSTYNKGFRLAYSVFSPQLDSRSLLTPQNLRWEGNYAAWDLVDGYSSYRIQLYLNGEAERYYDFEGDKGEYPNKRKISFGPVGKYTFTVMTKITDRPAEYSQPSEMSPIRFFYVERSVQNLRWDGKTAKWDPPQEPYFGGAYQIFLYKNGTRVSTEESALSAPREFDFSAKLREYGAGEYYFSVIVNYSAIGPSATIPSSVLTYIGDDNTPQNLRWEGKTAKWDALDGLTYVLELYKDSVSIESNLTANTGEYDFTELMELYGFGSYTFRAAISYDGTTYPASAPSPAYLHDGGIPIPQNLRWGGAVARWDAVVPTPDSYVVLLYKDNTPVRNLLAENTVTAWDFAAALNEYGKGAYTFHVLASQDGVESIPGKSDTLRAIPAVSNGLLTGTTVSWNWNDWSSVPEVSFNIHIYRNGVLLPDATVTVTPAEASLTEFSRDIADVIEENGYGTYTIGVAAVSGDYASVELLAEGNYGHICPGHTVSGTVTSYGNATDTVTLQLKQGESVIDTQTATNGNYSFADVTAGTYTLVVSKAKHATREYTVTVGESNIEQNAEIWLYGDATGDGVIDNKDIMQINRKIANISSVFDLGTVDEQAYRFKVANVTAITGTNAILDNVDVLQINRKISNLSSVFDSLN